MRKVFLLLILAGVPLFLFAKIDSIPYGTNLVGEISYPGEIDTLHFFGSIGDRLWVRMGDAQSSVDASLRLYQDDSILVTIEGAGGDIQIFDYTLEKDAGCLLVVYDHNHNDTGDYGLALHKINNPAYARKISCGDDIRDTIATEVACQVYVIDVQEGDLALAQMRAESRHLESSIYIFDSDGNRLHKSQRKSNSYAFIEPFSVDSTDQFSVFIFDANGNDTGEYGFTYQDLNSDCGNIHATQKEYVHSAISKNAEIHAMRIGMAAGDGLVCKALALNQGFETKVEIYDPHGQKIAGNRVSGKANDLIIPTVLDEGMYTILLSDDRANDKSEYHFSISLINPDCAYPLALCQRQEVDLERPAELNLYYFYMAEKINPIKIKEIDRNLEFYVNIVNDQMVITKKEASKVIINGDDLIPGQFTYLIVSDNGGNDVGKYRIGPEESIDGEGIDPPVAFSRKEIHRKIPDNGNLQLSVKEVDRGSYDDCQLVRMEVIPNLFTCGDLGEHQVQLVVTDNLGQKDTSLSVLHIYSDLELVYDPCTTYSVDQYLDNNCLKVEVSATGGSGIYSYQWSNGKDGAEIRVCPDEVEILSCSVYDANGCNSSGVIMLPLGENISCHPNGKKVTICHQTDEGSQELCVAQSSLSDHLGHGDLLGPCDQPDCLDGSVAQKNMVHQPIINSVSTHAKWNTTSQIISFESSERKIKQINAVIVNALGQIIYQKSLTENAINDQIDIRDLQLTKGVYYMHVEIIGALERNVETINIIIQ